MSNDSSTPSPMLTIAERRSQLEEQAQENWRRICRSYTPMSAIGPEYNVKITYPPPRLLWYGIAITFETLKEYAKRRGIWPDPTGINLQEQVFIAEWKCQKLLREELDWPILELRCPYSPDYELSVGIYSSYKIEEQILDKESQSDLIDAIQDALEIEDEPMWYFDQENYDEDFLYLLRLRQKRGRARQMALDQDAGPSNKSK
ncbi:hypothetical protein BC834DRAFT_409198 [Gloeopeniophorella convolvens]|nr:hypothetical protein BC834DRAFT_409198 [Gloeopeniophorella convolvens]